MPEATLIAIAAEDDRGLDGGVSAHFGRCPFYVLVQTNGDTATLSRVIPNPYFSEHQPGVLPRFLHHLGADGSGGHVDAEAVEHVDGPWSHSTGDDHVGAQVVDEAGHRARLMRAEVWVGYDP